jgi:hypothetical protein
MCVTYEKKGVQLTDQHQRQPQQQPEQQQQQQQAFDHLAVFAVIPQLSGQVIVEKISDVKLAVAGSFVESTMLMSSLAVCNSTQVTLVKWQCSVQGSKNVLGVREEFALTRFWKVLVNDTIYK